MEREYRKFRKEEKGRSIWNGIFCKTGRIGLEKEEGRKGLYRGKQFRKRLEAEDSEKAERSELCAGDRRREHRKREWKFCVKIERRK